MMDTLTRKRLSVSNDAIAGPYIMTPVSQLESLCKLLEERQVPYSVDEDVVSLNGKPEMAVVNLGRGANVAVIQDILDSVG